MVAGGEGIWSLMERNMMMSLLKPGAWKWSCCYISSAAIIYDKCYALPTYI